VSRERENSRSSTAGIDLSSRIPSLRPSLRCTFFAHVSFFSRVTAVISVTWARFGILKERREKVTALFVRP